MRKFLWSAISAVALFVSCAEADIEVRPLLGGEDFTATIAETRTELDGVAVLWNEADELTIFTKTAHNRKYRAKSLSNNGRSATFGYVTFTGSDNTAIENNYSVYPYDAEATLSGDVITTKINAEQVYNAEKVDLSNALMVAKSSSTALQYVNSTALMRFDVANNMPDSYTLSSIEITSVANKLAGKVTIDLSDDCQAVVAEDGVNVVTLSGIDTAITTEAKTFYVVLPATSFEANDLTVKFTYTEGVSKSFTLPAFDLTVGTIKTISYTINEGEDFEGSTPDSGEDFEGETPGEESTTPANNEIYYTTTDGAVANFPTEGNYFNVAIESNTYENGLGVVTFAGALTACEASAFANLTNLKSIILPDGFYYLNEYAFDNCSNLELITIPETVTVIGHSAFLGCSKLAEVIIPEGITEMYGETFKNCSSLTNISLPSSLTSFGMSEFEGCTSLKNITIPEKMSFIGGVFIILYLEAQNNQKQPEITKYKPLIISIF